MVRRARHVKYVNLHASLSPGTRREQPMLMTPQPMTYSMLSTTPAPDPAYVPPGRLLASRDPQPMTTIVSSGAVVCVWDPVSAVGGMAHFLLPEKGNAPAAPRFGDVALETLVAELVKLGAPERRLRARVFGGSAPPIATEGRHLGDRNIEAALSFLQARLVPVIEQQAGGASARKILFTPRTGVVEVTRIGLN
jgi:chemotaxis protein CheD